MRALLVPAALAALSLAPAALAAESATGTVKSLDMKAHTLTLGNGRIYHLPTSFADPGLKAGEKVQISWAMQNGHRDASAVTVVK